MVAKGCNRLAEAEAAKEFWLKAEEVC